MYIFQGGGFIPGVPGRDLTNDEARSFGVPVEGTALYFRDRDGEPPPEDDASHAVINDVIDDESEVEHNVDSD